MDTKKLRQKILDLAIRGKLVPQDPNDEPASVLLERIQAEKEQLIKNGEIKRSKKSASSDTYPYENVPFEIPESWVWTTLGNIGQWQSGATPSRLCKKYYGGTIPWLKTGDLNDGYIYDIPEYITEKALAETSVKLNPVGSILIAMYGATIGKVGMLTFPATTNQACCACVDYSGIEQKYLFYFLVSHKEEFIMQGGGGAQPNISKEKIVETLIPIPPRPEQVRIVNIIENWFAIIDKIEQEQVDLTCAIKQTKSKILDIAIHGKLVPQDPNDEPAIELLRRINPSFKPCDNAHYQYNLPDNWEWTTLGNIGKWQSGGTPDRKNKSYYNGEIPWLRIADLQDDYITEATEFITQEGLNNSSTKFNPIGSVALAMYGSIGKVGILTFPSTTNQAICVCSNYIIAQKYLFYYLISQRDNFFMQAGGGVQANISKQIIVKHPIPIPPYAEQKRIVAKIEELFVTIDKIKESLEA
ncbi:restriction endonuclease subunit S [uncultured Alistipes sp.]|uniref:restriction endonuclease subunit S n=3 Tax=uncultured Alistipes sp. TaxID=538949 RepID=UPI0025936CBE|nr:restriction endonuclease subunit S [uncultured Alistipes sp.]